MKATLARSTQSRYAGPVSGPHSGSKLWARARRRLHLWPAAACVAIACLSGCSLTTPLDGLSTPRDPDAQGTPTTGEYGVLTKVSFSTSFILDGARQEDYAYVNAHAEAFQSSAAFVGSYTSLKKKIPPAAAESLSTSAHRAEIGVNLHAIFVLQYGFGAAAVVSPLVLLETNSDALVPGPLVVPNQAFLAVVELDGSGGYKCAAAIGYGPLEVKSAVNTTKTDGGSLWIEGTDIKLYHPIATPEGDQSAVVSGMGGPCPLE